MFDLAISIAAGTWSLFAVAFVGGFLFRLKIRSYSGPQRQWLWTAFGARLAATVAGIAITTYVYGVGDIFAYERFGRIVSDLLLADFGEHFTTAAGAALTGETNGAIPSYGDGPATSMVSITGLLLYALNDSILAASLVFSLFSLFGSLALLEALRARLPSIPWRFLMVAVLWVPTVVYWSSGIIKEAAALGGLGFAIAGVMDLVDGPEAYRRRSFVRIAFGSAVVWIVKPYLLVPFAAAVLLAVVVRQDTREVDPWKVARWLGTALFVVVGWAVMGALIPNLSPAGVAEQLGSEQQAWIDYSNATIDLGGAAGSSSLSTQIGLAPIGLLNSLTRPLLFEASNPLILLNALETAALTLLLFRALITRGPLRLLRRIAGSRWLSFMAVFVGLAGIGIGLGTANLGALSRFRSPFLVLYVPLLLELNWPVLTRAFPAAARPDATGRLRSSR